MQPQSHDNHTDQNGSSNPPKPNTFTLKLQRPKYFKRILSAINTTSPRNSNNDNNNNNNNALLEILNTGVLIHVTVSAHDMFILLRIKTTSFQYYSCQRSYVVSLNFRELSKIVNSAKDDEAITISADEEDTSLHFSFANQNGEEKRKAAMEATEVSTELWTTDEPVHEFKVCIRSSDFAHILEYAKLHKEAIQITMMSTMVTVVSGCEILTLREEYFECVIEHAPTNMKHDLWLSLNHINSFLLASSLLTASVWIHDSQSRSNLPPLLEFPLSELGKLLVYLPQPFAV